MQNTPVCRSQGTTQSTPQLFLYYVTLKHIALHPVKGKNDVQTFSMHSPPYKYTKISNNSLCKGDPSCTSQLTGPSGYSPCKGRQRYGGIRSAHASPVAGLKRYCQSY